MLPFNNIPCHNFGDLYSNAPYFANHPYFMPQDPLLPYINPFQDSQNPILSYVSPYFTNIPPFHQQQQEEVVKIEERVTKPRQTEEKRDNQSDVSVHNLGDQEQLSPHFRFKQKYGRNVNSNIFYHMYKRLIQNKNFAEIAQKIIARYQSILSYQQFKELLERKGQKLRSYISVQKMTKMFQGQKYRNRIYAQTLLKEKQFCKIFRIICRYYLKNEHILYVFNTLKITEQSKRLHISGARKILHLMNSR